MGSDFLQIISSTGKDKNFIWEEVWGYSHFVATNYEQLGDLRGLKKR